MKVDELRQLAVDMRLDGCVDSSRDVLIRMISERQAEENEVEEVEEVEEEEEEEEEEVRVLRINLPAVLPDFDTSESDDDSLRH